MITRSRRDPNSFASELFHDLPGKYDALGYLLSFGQDRRWRHEMVGHVHTRPAGTVLDVATGPGGIAFALRRATGASVVGLDLTGPMLAKASANIERRCERQILLVQGRGEQLPFADGSFDAVTFSYLLRYVSDPQAVLAELARVLRPGGTLASLEFHAPENPGWLLLWWFYTRAVLPLAGLLLGGREWQLVGRFLGPSISSHYRRYPVSWTIRAWRRAGLEDVGSRIMSVGGGLVMWATKPPPSAVDAQSGDGAGVSARPGARTAAGRAGA